MKKIITWIMLVAMILGMFAGCGQSADPAQVSTTAPVEIPEIPAATENNALDVVNYLQAIYKDSGAKTSGDFERFGVVRIAGVPYTVEWTTDVSAYLVNVVVNDDGTVTIDVNEKCTEDTPYVLTATITDSNGNTETASWEYLLPGVASVEEMQAIVDQAYSLEVGEAMSEAVTLYGVITSIDTPYSEQYQNITVTIQIEGREDKPIMCYRLKGEGAADLNPGDTISVQGIIKNYNNKIEFDAGCTINFVEKTGTPVVIPSDPHQILNDVYALGDNESLPYGPVTMTGRICSIDTPYSEQYKNITVTICIDWYTIKCYRLKGEGAESLEMNDIITVKGYIKKYNGTREFDVPELLDVVKVGEVPQPSDPLQVVKTAYALDPGWSVPYGEVTLTGYIDSVNTAWSDEFKNITVTMYIDCDVDKQYPIECYRMVSSGGENDEKIKDLKKGDLIVTKGVLMKYQSASGSTKVELNCPELVMVATREELTVLNAYKGITTGEKEYITGTVMSIDKAYTAADGVSLTLVLDYMVDKPVKCINVKGLNADKLKVADKITVMGVVSVEADGTVKMGPDCNFIPTVLPNDSKAIATYAATLLPDQRMVDDCIVTGKVVSIDSAYRAQYDNVTLTIDVEGTKIQCYRLKGDDAATVGENDEIIVNGFLTNYNGKIQFIEGCKFVTLKKGQPAASASNSIVFNNVSKRTELTTTKQVWKENGITVTNEKAGSVTNIADYSNPARFYKNSSLTIEYPGMMQIVVNCDDYKDTYPTDLVSSISGATAVANGTAVTITFAAPVDSFKIPDLKGQVRVDSISVYTEVQDPETPGTPDTPDSGSLYMTEAPKNGDKVVIVAAKYNKALSTTKVATYYNAGVDVTASGSKLNGYGDSEVWTVIVNEDGTYSFENGGKKIAMQASNSSMMQGAVNDKWKVNALGDGMFNIVNVGRSGMAMEWYASKGNFSTYSKNITTDDQFFMAFYLVEAAEEPSLYMTEAPKNGDEVVIVAANYNKALSTTKVATYYNAGVNVTASGNKLSGYADSEVWKVIVNADGTYSFENGGKKIAMQASNSSMMQGAVNDKWKVNALGNGLFNIVNVGRSGMAMEWYSAKGNFSTYSKNITTDDQFFMAFYLVKSGSGSVTPPVTPEEPETPDTPAVDGALVLTVDSMKIAANTYYTGKATVGGIGLDLTQIGNYGAGVQMRDKDGKTSILFNTDALPGKITKIELKSNSTKKVYSNANAVIFSFGATKDNLTYSTKLSTVADQTSYTIVPEGDFSFFKIEHDLGYTLYWDSITIYYEAGSGSEGGETPDTPPVATSATITFDDTAKRTVFTTSQQVWVENGVTVTNDKASSTSNVGDYKKPARFYKGSKLTIAYPGMTKIEVSCNTAPYANELKNSISGATVTVSGKIVTIELPAAVDSFVVAAMNAQVRVDSLTVYTGGSQGGTTPDPEPEEPELTQSDISAALAATSGEFMVKGVVTFKEVTSSSTNLYLQDATGAICVRVSGTADVNVGDTVIATGTRGAYGGLPQLTGSYEKSSGMTLSTKKMILDDLADEHLCTSISVDGLTVTAVNGTNITVQDDVESIIVLYKPVTSAELKVGDKFNFTGSLGVYNGTYQLRNSDASEIVIVTDEPVTPPPAEPVVSHVDFNTIQTSNANGDSGYTKTYTTSSGWTTVNSAIQTGGAAVVNPQYPVIGADNTTKAVCINGKTTAAGYVVSPTLTGGISKLSIKYTKMFTDTKLGATITITDKATGNTYTKTISRDVEKDADKYVVWTFDWVLDTPITGDFTIAIVNTCPSGSTSNKDRMTILDIAWTSAV